MHLPLYWIAQLLGAIAGAVINLLIFHNMMLAKEANGGYSRGDQASVFTASGWVGVFPAASMVYRESGTSTIIDPSKGWAEDIVTPFGCMCIEAWGTGILVFVIFCVTDPRNGFFGHKHSGSMVPFFIGFTVACLISLYGTHTSGAFNPAREFGPRFVAYCAGWGDMALPGHRGGWWAYIVGPMIGGPIGGALHDFILARGYHNPEEKKIKPVKVSSLSPEAEALLLEKFAALLDKKIEERTVVVERIVEVEKVSYLPADGFDKPTTQGTEVEMEKALWDAPPTFDAKKKSKKSSSRSKEKKNKTDKVDKAE